MALYPTPLFWKKWKQPQSRRYSGMAVKRVFRNTRNKVTPGQLMGIFYFTCLCLQFLQVGCVSYLCSFVFAVFNFIGIALISGVNYPYLRLHGSITWQRNFETSKMLESFPGTIRLMAATVCVCFVPKLKRKRLYVGQSLHHQDIFACTAFLLF
jgi:hypothetical protein